jgi:WD40 repeat protein
MVTFNRTGARVIVAGEKNNAGRVTVADATTGRALVRLPVHGTQPPVGWVDISPDSRLAALATQGRPVSLWDLRNIADPRKIGAFGDSDATRVDFSPDGKRVVVAGTDGVARVFNVRTRREMLSFRRHTAWLTGAVFSRDGNRILSYGFDRTARVWDSRTGGEVAVLRGHTSWIKSGEFSPDGKRVVTSAIDATVRVWDAATGRMLAVERPHADQTTSASFAPHDGLLLTSGFDGTVKLGACDSCGSLDALVALAGRRVTRDLTGVEREDFLGER